MSKEPNVPKSQSKAKPKNNSPTQPLGIGSIKQKLKKSEEDNVLLQTELINKIETLNQRETQLYGLKEEVKKLENEHSMIFNSIYDKTKNPGKTPEKEEDPAELREQYKKKVRKLKQLLKYKNSGTVLSLENQVNELGNRLFYYEQRSEMLEWTNAKINADRKKPQNISNSKAEDLERIDQLETLCRTQYERLNELQHSFNHKATANSFNEFLANIRESQATLETKLAEYEKRVESLFLREKHMQGNDLLKQRILQLEGELERGTSRRDPLSREISDATTNVHSLTETISRLRTELASKIKELDEITQNHQRITTEKDSKICELTEDLSKLERTVSDLNEVITKFSDELATTSLKLEQCKEMKKEFKQNLAEKQEELRVLKTDFSSHQNAIEGLETDKQELEERLVLSIQSQQSATEELATLKFSMNP